LRILLKAKEPQLRSLQLLRFLLRLLSCPGRGYDLAVVAQKKSLASLVWELSSLAEDTHQPIEPNSVGGSPLPFVLPFVALLAVPALVGWLFPEAEPIVDAAINSAGSSAFDWPAFLSALSQVFVVGGILFWYRRIYLAVFPWRFSLWSLVLGLIGVILWVALCSFQLESQFLKAIGLGGMLPQRPGVNPFESFAPGAVGWFLFFRFTVLMLVVPLAEELFVRGWLVRYLQAQENWDIQSLATVGWAAQFGVLGYAVLTHPQEAVAAIVWFGMVNWWMKRTGNFWDCVLVHAVTNGLLGAWILYSGQWWLW